MINYVSSSFDLFGLTIHWYAVCILIGIVLAVVAGVREGKKIGIPSDYIYTGLVIVLPCAIIGARLWYVLFNLSHFHSFMEVIGFNSNGQFVGLSGLAIQGGVLASLIAIYLYCRFRKISLYRILDVVAPGFLIGQICGRWGNFFNHELYGPKVVNTDLFEALLPSFITENMRIPENGPYYHPTFLYESLLNLLGLIVMFVLRRKSKKLQSGDLIGLYMIWYGGVRIFTEILRGKSGADEILMVGNVPVSILFSVLFIVGGIAFLVVKRFFCPKTSYLSLLKEIRENRYDTVLFDLDGTLLNTKELIDRSFIHTFEHFRPTLRLSDEELDSFFGPSLKQTFSRYSDDETEIAEMIAYYRSFNVEAHDEMVTAFPGAKALIRTLSKKGYHVGVVSSKKKDLVEHGLDLFGMLPYMEIIIGEEEVTHPKPDPEGIKMALAACGSKKALYVGDGVGDIEAGKAAGIDTVGVLYSKRKEQILAASPTYTIKNLADLLPILTE